MKVLKRIIGIFLVFMLVLGMAACNNRTPAEQGNTNQDAGSSTGNEPLRIGKADYAPHGDKSFAVAVTVMQGDKIVKAYIDEYQFLPKADITGVPNSNETTPGAFASNFKDPDTVLASKKVNDSYYSQLMKEHAGATNTLGDNYAAIENYVSGKTIAELESELSGKDAKQVTDAVSGSTLVDTKGYIEAFVAAAKNVR